MKGTYFRVLVVIDTVAGKVFGGAAIEHAGLDLAFVDATRKPTFELIVVSGSLC